MDIKILERRENKLLNREEVYAIADHRGEPTPKREDIKKKVAAMIGKSEDLIVVLKIMSSYGLQRSKVILHVYNSKDDMMKIEPKYILKRNKVIQ